MTIIINKVLSLALTTGLVTFGSAIAKSTHASTACDNALLSSLTEQKLHLKAGEFGLGSALPANSTYIKTVTQTDYPKSHSLEIFHPERTPDANTLALFGPWFVADGISQNTGQLIEAIQSAAVHGLNPEAYGLKRLLLTEDMLGVLDTKFVHENNVALSHYQEAKDKLRADFIKQLDDAFVKLSTHLGQGVVDAASVQRRQFHTPPDIDAQGLLNKLHTGEHSVNSALSSVTPTHDDYKRLARKMRKLLTERSSEFSRNKVFNDSTYPVAQLTDDILSIQRRLIHTGDLPSSSSLSTTWDKTVSDAVKAFQHRHGFIETGEADEQTRAALNLTVEQEIEAVALSLERWRWMPRKLGLKHVLVNIPAYRVEVRSGTSTLLSMRTVVGSVKNPTPTFSRDMSYMEFNPTWTVPKSITNSKLIPLERKNPGYLASRNFHFLKHVDGKLVRVPEQQVTKNDFLKDVFPYVLQQQGGPINTLGRMKFMMPNPYSVYLHDTQSKDLFAENERAFSHGCIRLSEPEKMARLLMELDGRTDKFVSDVLSTKDTKRVLLKEPIPTHLIYHTTWVDDNGVSHRRNDIYQHDTLLIEALRTSNTLITTLQSSDLVVASRD